MRCSHNGNLHLEVNCGARSALYPSMHGTRLACFPFAPLKRGRRHCPTVERQSDALRTCGIARSKLSEPRGLAHRVSQTLFIQQGLLLCSSHSVMREQSGGGLMCSRCSEDTARRTCGSSSGDARREHRRTAPFQAHHRDGSAPSISCRKETSTNILPKNNYLEHEFGDTISADYVSIA